MPNLALQPGNVPQDEAFPPANWQILLNVVASYLGVSGLENLQGVVISAEEPAAADRDKVWVKRDGGSDRPLGFYVYTGEWLPLPFIIPSGEAGPAGAKIGELFFNTLRGCVEVFNGTVWTTNLWPSGNTASRPTEAGVGYLFFDTDIQRLLRMTSQGWSTFDGCIGEVRMFDFADEATALSHNPGWSVFGPMSARFPIGVSEETPAQQEGGVKIEEMELEWSAKRRSASGGNRESSATFIAELTINDVAKTADGTKSDGLTEIGQPQKVNLKPPYKALYFLRKDF
jgi:hypothetical protein